MKTINSIAFSLVLLAMCINAQTLTAQTCTGPNKLKATIHTAFSVRLLWSPGGGNETLNYRPIGATQWQRIPNVQMPYILNGLTAATTYEYYFSTDCATYSGTPPQSRFTTLESCMPAQNIAASNIKINSAQISWIRGTGISNEILVYKEVGATNSFRITVPFGMPNFRISGLKANTDYEVVVESDCPINSQPINNIGTVMSPPHRFRTAAAASCTDGGLRVVLVGDNRIVASWANSGSVQSIDVCYKNLSDNTETCSSLPTNATGYEIYGKFGTSYKISVSMTCSDGTIFTNSETVKTGDLPPTPYSVRAINPTFIGGVYGYAVAWEVTSSLPPNYTYEVTFEFLTAVSGNTFSNLVNQLIQITTGLPNDLRRARVKVKDATGTIISQAVSDPYSWYSIGGVVAPLVGNSSTSLSTFNSKKQYNSDTGIKNPDNEFSQLHLKENLSNGVLSISPNPANTVMIVNFPVAGFDQIQITSLDGRIVKQIQVDANSISQKIDCTELTNGLYFLTAKGLGKVVTEKFVKN